MSNSDSEVQWEGRNSRGRDTRPRGRTREKVRVRARESKLREVEKQEGALRMPAAARGLLLLAIGPQAWRQEGGKEADSRLR